MIQRNVKKKASGMLLNNMGIKRLSVICECQQISVTDLNPTSHHVRSPSLPHLPRAGAVLSVAEQATQLLPALFQGSLLAFLCIYGEVETDAVLQGAL